MKQFSRRPMPSTMGVALPPYLRRLIAGTVPSRLYIGPNCDFSEMVETFTVVRSS